MIIKKKKDLIKVNLQITDRYHNKWVAKDIPSIINEMKRIIEINRNLNKGLEKSIEDYEKKIQEIKEQINNREDDMKKLEEKLGIIQNQNIELEEGQVITI